MKLHVAACAVCVGLGSVLGLMAGCADKGAQYIYPNGAGGNVASGGASGGNVASGGASGGNIASGGVVGSGGAAGSGRAGVCPSDPNLATHLGWVGCDPTIATDNPMGIQGSVYGYGDNTTCTPPMNPCTGATCCISGATVVDPTFVAWGCGMGLELNATGGDASVKQPYTAATGPLGCFDITLTGSSGGNKVRIGFPYAADMTDKVSPFYEITQVVDSWSGRVCFADATCPTWDTMNRCMLGDKYDLQIQVVGGELAAPFNLCLSNLVPLDASGMGGVNTLGQLCGAVGQAGDYIHSGTYRIQNNVYGGGSQCITAKAGGGVAAFTIDSASLNTSGNAPVAYPSVVYGWHYGDMTMGTPLPKALNTITSAPSSVSYQAGSGKYNAAYDIWMHPQSTGQTSGCGSSTQCPNGGLEIMIWLGTGGNPQPYGSMAGNVTLNNQSFEVWTGNVNGQWQYVAYWLKSGSGTFSGDLRPFMADAVGRAGGNDAWYLLGIQFGFEIWQYGGPAFSVNSFSASVN
jgi:Glycosyl hydrolase family 12